MYTVLTRHNVSQNQFISRLTTVIQNVEVSWPCASSIYKHAPTYFCIALATNFESYRLYKLQHKIEQINFI